MLLTITTELSNMLPIKISLYKKDRLLIYFPLYSMKVSLEKDIKKKGFRFRIFSRHLRLHQDNQVQGHCSLRLRRKGYLLLH